MTDSTKKKQEFQIEAIKTPEGNVPTVESFHKVIDGLFGEVLDTRKDIAKLIPNIEKELDNLREILAQQMVLFEIINSNVNKIEKQINDQEKSILKILKETEGVRSSASAEVELTEESKKAIAKVITTEIDENIKPINESIKRLKADILKSASDTEKMVDTRLSNIRDQLEDISSKTELQMLEILESLNQQPSEKSGSKSSPSSSKTDTKKKLPA
ncbi:MAG: hypothetical protein ACFFDW_00410 [Candidatus Thorarchaeota archaeon]